MSASHPVFNPRPVFCSMCAWTGDHSEARPFPGGPVPSGMEVARFCPDCGEQVQDGEAPETPDFLYAAALAADRRFSKALRKAFGRDACNRRYDADNSSHPAEVREACAEYLTASERWREALRAAREKQDEREEEDEAAARFGTPAEEVGDVVGLEAPTSDPDIELYVEGGFWVAEHHNHLAAEVLRLFGTTIIPTPFGASAAPQRVLENIASLNPDCTVRLREAQVGGPVTVCDACGDESNSAPGLTCGRMIFERDSDEGGSLYCHGTYRTRAEMAAQRERVASRMAQMDAYTR